MVVERPGVFVIGFWWVGRGRRVPPRTSPVRPGGLRAQGEEVAVDLRRPFDHLVHTKVAGSLPPR